MVAYGILCVAATGRSVFQIGTKFSEAPLAYSISAVSAVLYGVIAYALWKRHSRVALIGTAVELAGVLVVGTLSWAAADLWPEATVWTGYGSGYGWFPLVLPAVALWLLLRERRAEGRAA